MLCARWCGIEIAPIRRQGRQTMHRYDLPRRSLAYGIAGLAGFVDAAGFLAAGGYFVSFMSGNTTRFGVEAATQPEAALVPILLILCFVSGVTAGAVVADRSERPKSAVLMLSTLLIGVGATAHALGAIAVFVGMSALAMGAINNAFRREGEVAVGVTYMTGALVRFGQGLAARLTGRQAPGGLAHLLLWASLAAGAVLGAHVTIGLPALAPWIPLVWAAGLCIAARRIERARA